MTYGLAVKLDKGLVFASDSRTSAGVDYVTTYSKMHTFVWPDEMVCVLLTSGNLATSQAVVNAVRNDLDNCDANFNLRMASHIHEAARYIGRLSQAEQEQHREAVKQSGSSVEASFILGGQIAEKPPELYLIYPQGNYISASPETPFLQIGEAKYGKPILDRIVTPNTSLEDAARCAMVSLDSTMSSNISVGPPLELAIYQKGSLNEPRNVTFNLTSPFFRHLQKRWNDGLRRTFNGLPRFEWE